MKIKEKNGTQMAQSQAPDYNQIEKAAEEAIELALAEIWRWKAFTAKE